MDFKQLRSFVSVVKYGNFTTAAAKLRISQPTVSTHLHALEEEFGQPLVLRTAKRVRPTSFGSKMYEQAVAILCMHDRMMKNTENRGDTVYIGASSIPATYILPEALCDFRKSHPGSHFVIHQGDSQDITDGVFDGVYDLGLVGMATQGEAVNCIPFCSDRIVLITPNEAPFNTMNQHQPVDAALVLDNSEVILREVGSGTRAETNRILKELGIDERDLKIVARQNDQQAIKNLVEYGYGVSFASWRAVRKRVRDGRLLAFDIANADTHRHFFIIHRKSVVASERASQIMAYLRLRYGSEL